MNDGKDNANKKKESHKGSANQRGTKLPINEELKQEPLEGSAQPKQNHAAKEEKPNSGDVQPPGKDHAPQEGVESISEKDLIKYLLNVQEPKFMEIMENEEKLNALFEKNKNNSPRPEEIEFILKKTKSSQEILEIKNILNKISASKKLEKKIRIPFFIQLLLIIFGHVLFLIQIFNNISPLKISLYVFWGVYFVFLVIHFICWLRLIVKHVFWFYDLIYIIALGIYLVIFFLFLIILIINSFTSKETRRLLMVRLDSRLYSEESGY